MLMMGMTKEEMAREQARQAAIEQMGASWIELRLIDPRRRRIGAIETVVAKLDVDSDTGETIAIPMIVPGDERFKRVGGRAARARILDSEFNRQVLASHYDLNYWEIVDPKIRAEIAKLAKRLERRARKEPPGPVAAQPPAPSVSGVGDMDLRALSEEQREELLQRLLEDRAQRDAERPPEPVRQTAPPPEPKPNAKTRKRGRPKTKAPPPAEPAGEEEPGAGEDENAPEHTLVTMEHD